MRRSGGALPAGGFPILLIDEDQIDIRRHIQLAAAELAHANDAEREPLAVGRAGLAVKRLQIGRKHRERALHGRFGEISHRAGHFGDVGLGAEIALHHRAEHLRAQAAQREAQRILADRGSGLDAVRFTVFGNERAKPRIDTLARNRRFGPGGDAFRQFGTGGDRARAVEGIGGTQQVGSSHE